MHILNQSKKLGDKLIVLLSSDEQIKFLKGINRPINKLEDRLKLFTLVPYVDYVYVYYENLVINNETELDKLMNIVMPDIWTKGDDYNINDIYKKHPSLNKIEIIKRTVGQSGTSDERFATGYGTIMDGSPTLEQSNFDKTFQMVAFFTFGNLEPYQNVLPGHR